MRRKRILHFLLMGLQSGPDTLQISVESPQKAKSNLLYDPAIPFLVIQSKDLTSYYSTDISSAMFIAALLTIARIWKQPRCPTTKK